MDMSVGEMDDVLDCLCFVFVHRSVRWYSYIMASNCIISQSISQNV